MLRYIVGKCMCVRHMCIIVSYARLYSAALLHELAWVFSGLAGSAHSFEGSLWLSTYFASGCVFIDTCSV